MRRCFLIMLLFIAAEVVAADKTITKIDGAEMFTEFDLSGSLTPLSVHGESTIDWHETLPKSSTPWSGYSWSIKHEGLQFPLNVYDRYDIGKTAAKWEKTYRISPDSYNSAWAASALLEKEPAGNSDEIKALRKGLLAGIYDSAKMKIIAGKQHEDSQKIQCTPKELWMALQEYFVRHKHSIIVCFDGEKHDRNIPIFAYRITCIPESPESEKHACIMTLLGVDTTSSRNDHKLNVQKYTVQFVSNLDREGKISDEGQWKSEGNSVIPSYAWIPLSPDEAPIRNEQLNKVKVRNLINMNDNEIQDYLVQVTPKPVTPKPVTPKPVTPKMETPVLKPIYLSIEEMLYLMSNKHSDFSFNASIKGGDGSIRRTGEKFKVFVESERSGFLYIIAVNSGNDISMIYPVRGENNYIAGSKEVTALPKDDRYFQFSKNFPAGAVRLKVFLTGVPIHISGADDIKILDRQQLSDQSLRAEGIDTEDLFGVMITEDNTDEMVPMCWLTRRLRMARQQRRAVANSVKKFPESGEITPPQVPEEEEENTSGTTDEIVGYLQHSRCQCCEEMNTTDETPFKIIDDENSDKNKKTSEISNSFQSDETVISEKKTNTSKTTDETLSTITDDNNSDKNPFKSKETKTEIGSDEKPNQEPDVAKTEPEPVNPDSSGPIGTDVADKPDNPQKVAKNNSVTDQVKVPVVPPIDKPKSILDDHPFPSITEQKPNKVQQLPDGFGSPPNKVATTISVAKSENTPSTIRTLKNNYSEIITRNARALFKGFAQDEVLIIFSDKPENSIQ